MLLYFVPKNNLLKEWVLTLRDTINHIFGEALSTPIMSILEVIVWILILYILDVIAQKIIGVFIKKIVSITKLTWDNVFYDQKVFRSLIHFIPIGLAFSISQFVPSSFSDLKGLTEKGLGILLIFVFVQLTFRVIGAIIEIAKDDNSYTTIGVRTFGQMIKMLSIFIAILIGIAVLFNVDISKILTVLGALTAVILLIFKDSILGFVSGLQLATSRSIKVGDWISISKYSLEGYVREINLSIAKIEKFDKTIATIPTYDLVATEVTNFSIMTSSNTRRIKRSIVFNLKSFTFCSDEMIASYQKMELIKEYIDKKSKEIQKHNEQLCHPEMLINGRRLTNIGVFRHYTINYLKSHPNIDQSPDSPIIVRQMEITPQGMPLEIYCFTDTSNWETYESIQGDIFDHLLSACKEFDLEVSQLISLKD